MLWRGPSNEQNFQCFQYFGLNHDISNKGLYEWSRFLCFCGKSIPNLKSTRSPEQTEETAHLQTFLEINTRLGIYASLGIYTGNTGNLHISYSCPQWIEANFVWSSKRKNFPVETVPTKINTKHLWNLTQCNYPSPSEFAHCNYPYRKCYCSLSEFAVTNKKDCGEKFQKVQKLIKSFLINS